MRRALILKWTFAFTLTTALSARATTVNTIASFNGANGSVPQGTLLFDATNNLYGVTEQGGANSKGTVFKVAAGTHALTTLTTFNGTNGASPESGLIADASGNLYGATRQGGSNNQGTVYKLDAATNALSTIATFNITDINGSLPYGNLIADASGNLYGTAAVGGHGGSGFGTIFKVAANTNTLSQVATFNGGINGSDPIAGLIADASGNFYGTAFRGGSNNLGTVYMLPAGTNTLTALASFNMGNGSSPQGGVIADASGNLFGTTRQGGANNLGTVFEVTADTNTLITLITFDSTNGANPYAGVIADALGNLYGTTNVGGPSNRGTVFKLDASSNYALTTLATFDGGANGGGLNGGLTADAAGNLYGTTVAGGPGGDGTVFELTNTGFVPIPEPASLALLGISVMGFTVRIRKHPRPRN